MHLHILHFCPELHMLSSSQLQSMEYYGKLSSYNRIMLPLCGKHLQFTQTLGATHRLSLSQLQSRGQHNIKICPTMRAFILTHFYHLRTPLAVSHPRRLLSDPCLQRGHPGVHYRVHAAVMLVQNAFAEHSRCYISKITGPFCAFCV